MENSTAKTMRNVATAVIILGIIGSLILGKVIPVVDYSYSGFGNYEADTSYNWALAIVGIIISVITYILFLGFAEVIDLLQRIQKNWQVVDLLQRIEKNEAVVTLLERIAENQDVNNQGKPSNPNEGTTTSEAGTE